MEKVFNNLSRTDWAEKRAQRINEEHKAGFIHNDMPITNPVILEISKDTMSNLKSLTNKPS